jgi:hypothetical protein
MLVKPAVIAVTACSNMLVKPAVKLQPVSVEMQTRQHNVAYHGFVSGAKERKHHCVLVKQQQQSAGNLNLAVWDAPLHMYAMLADLSQLLACLFITHLPDWRVNHTCTVQNCNTLLSCRAAAVDEDGCGGLREARDGRGNCTAAAAQRVVRGPASASKCSVVV